MGVAFQLIGRISGFSKSRAHDQPGVAGKDVINFCLYLLGVAIG